MAGMDSLSVSVLRSFLLFCRDKERFDRSLHFEFSMRE